MNILTVVVTINILVSPRLSGEIPVLVERLVLLLPDVLDESEVLPKKTKIKIKCKFHQLSPKEHQKQAVF